MQFRQICKGAFIPQDDWVNWSKMTAATPIQIVGDDLTVTNPIRINTAVEKKACNCLLLKVRKKEKRLFSEIHEMQYKAQFNINYVYAILYQATNRLLQSIY